MENHPIPQDVTGFKFKLIGSITVKQFLYLLGGGILSVVVFILPINFFLKIPFIMMFFGTGSAFAFVPVDGRPMDKMMMSFLKTIPSENEYIYHKKGVNLAAFAYFQAPKALDTHPEQNTPTDENYKKNLFLAQLRNSSYKPDEQETAFMKNLKTFFDDSVTQKTPINQTDPNTAADTAHRESIQPIRVQRVEAESVKSVQPVVPQETAKPVDTTHESDTLAHQELVQAAVIKAAQSAHDTVKPVVAGSNAGAIRVVNAEAQLKSGFPSLPDIPNVILGIIKDPRGKVLPNILVEVVDSNGVPVRAFKTNQLGQFAAATPLPNGIYKITFEDQQKKNEFNVVEMTLSGAIFQPLEIISIDQREKLRLELFGGTSAQTAGTQPSGAHV